MPLSASGETPSRPAVLTAYLPYVLLFVMAMELIATLSGAHLAHQALWAGEVGVVLLARNRLGGREKYLLTLCVVLTALALWRDPAPGGVIAQAFDQAGFLMAFILLLGLLHEAAGSSPSIAACGEYLTRQPPGRRYYVLNVGTAIMGVLFNLGLVSFLVPLVQRGIASATPGDALNPVRERRQISAILRGFAWSVIWSPTAVAPLALMGLIPGINRHEWMLCGGVVFLLMLVIGGLEDRIRFRSYRPAPGKRVAAFPTAAALRFGAACLWLFGMSGLVAWASGDSMIVGLMAACPVMLVGWLLTQHGNVGAEARAAVGARLAEIFRSSLAKAAPVAITLACAGYVGAAAASLIPSAELAQALGLNQIPQFVLLALIPVVLTAFSMFALSPIMMAVFFGSLFGSLPQLPADPTLLALSISCGWSLSMTISPFATVVLLTARVGNIPGTRLTMRWNWLFTIFAELTLWPVFYVLTGGQ